MAFGETRQGAKCHTTGTLCVLDDPHTISSVTCVLLFRMCRGDILQIARTAEHSRTGKAIPKGVIAQFEVAEAKKDEEIEKVNTVYDGVDKLSVPSH